ncbi:cysteine desulfurase [bacterium]|nr:cysteine desulfurase [bacterium]MBT4251246.1 cysteine desulfurase [bacterium]MBT4598373.1 cysteine desulfurase [bacterium]MBT6754206.1 cysteine desulfurase [bacterium]MBT7038023.1 cysteine desulfurase [bacterium]
MQKIYLDHSATTPMNEKVLDAMMPYFTSEFGNATSIHTFGQKASLAVQRARENTALFLNCKASEVVFTSGATEANNIAILGLIKALQKNNLGKIHIITSTIEHPAVLECFQLLEKEDDIEVSYLPVNSKGIVSKDEFEKLIKDNTVFVSMMYVNNETGAVQPILDIAKTIKKVKEKRKKEGAKFPLYFHTDAVQAANFFSCDVKDLGVDLMSLSGHKISGPKGVGVLFVKDNIVLEPIQFGGHQEKGLRSGTLNVPGIVGIGEALLFAEDRRKTNSKKVSGLRDMLIEGVTENIPDVVLNGDMDNISPFHANLGFKGIEGESILLDLDFEGIAVSTGSACASGALNPSHVLLAMGIRKEDAHGAIRFTLGSSNTEKEIETVIEKLPKIIKRLRKIAPKN